MENNIFITIHIKTVNLNECINELLINNWLINNHGYKIIITIVIK